MRVRRQVLGDDHGATLITLYILAKSHLVTEHYEACEPLALEFHERESNTNGPYIDKGRKLLASLYEAWGKPELGKKWGDTEQENK